LKCATQHLCVGGTFLLQRFIVPEIMRRIIGQYHSYS
jgi:hypothetical protein